MSEAVLELQKDILEDIFLLAAAPTHGMDLLHRRGHELFRSGVIPPHERQLALEQVGSEGGPMATGLALGKLSQVGDLPTRLLYIVGTRQGQTNPVMHPDGQV